MKLDARLRAAAEAAGRCALFADIGSDHAKLALHLLETGAAAYAVCADIHVSPLERGRQAAARTGLSERADFILSDGLDALPERPDVAAVCGMGGELIADIVARALRRFRILGEAEAHLRQHTLDMLRIGHILLAAEGPHAGQRGDRFPSRLVKSADARAVRLLERQLRLCDPLYESHKPDYPFAALNRFLQ